jgi:glycosyltransferase involved in cell wall biosynthesis
VLHVLKGLGPGGAERLVVSAAEVRSPDVAIDVAYLLPTKNHLVPELESAGARAHLIGGPRGLADPRWVWRLRHLVRRTRPDVVHVHSPAVAALARPVLRLARQRPRLVSTDHNVWRSFRLPTRVLHGLTTPLDDLRLAVSDEVRRSAWRWAQPRVSVLVHGVPVDRLAARSSERDAAREELGIADDAVVVTAVANFREKKDHATLLAAAAESRRLAPELQFLVVGQGPLEQTIRERHDQLGLGDTVRIVGFHPDPPRVLAASDVFTLTSVHEGLPIALLEAMAIGLPVVVSAVGGIPEVVRDDVEGVLVARRDVDGFARAYSDLAREAERRLRMGKNAASRAHDYDIRRAAEQLEAIYTELAGSEAPAPA